MLSQLNIVNFALVEQLDLEFAPGMTVITGETGAGKSIMLDALSLALGSRSDAGVIRHGAKQADISACFDISQNDPARHWLETNDLLDAHTCILRRVISADGRSKAYINGRPASVGLVKTLAPLLAEIHGQHGHHALLQADAQRELIDNFGNYTKLTKKVADIAKDFKATQKALTKLTANPEDGIARKQLLEYQVSELDELAMSADELPLLEEQQQTLSHANDILSTGQLIEQIIDGDGGVREQLNRSSQLLADMPVQSKQLELIGELLNSALIHTEEAASEVNSQNSSVELDPESLIRVEKRLDNIYSIARKHRVMPEELPELHQTLANELLSLTGIDQQVEELQAQILQLKDDYLVVAQELSKKREVSAKKLVKQVNEQLNALAMPHAKLSVNWQQNNAEPHAHGLEQAHLMIQTNPGQPAGPLNKVASGGELSRVGLSIAVVTASSATIPTLLFDEVDVGVGGSTASNIGQLMRSLGKNMQVLSVTHQPQVAAQSHQHWRVSKQVKSGNTSSQLEYLNTEERTEEIARMLGGAEVHQQARDNAKALLEEAVH